MKSEIFDIANIPAVIYGENSDECVLFIHGQGGNKFEAERFANTVSSKGYQVLAIDLPGHGERTDASKFVMGRMRRIKESDELRQKEMV